MIEANLHLIYKVGDATVASNYRPVSFRPLLPEGTKILEKLMNKRLLNYFRKQKHLSENQFGLRSDRKTENAITNLVDFVTIKLNSGEKCS